MEIPAEFAVMIEFIQVGKYLYIYIWVFPKIMVPPNHEF